jgi:HD-like signal output (HDOD) protein
VKPAVLFVDDEQQVLDGLCDLLRSRRRELRAETADGGATALERLAAEHFDVVVSDMRMPGLDGAQLLERVRDEHPHAVRVILSGQASEEAVLRMVPVAHIALAKPCSSRHLSQMLDRAFSVGGLLDDLELREAVNRIGALPSPPTIAQQLFDAIEDDAPAATLAGILEGDVGLSAKVLQLVNSGFFGIPQEIGDLRRAIPLVGVDLLRSLAVDHGVTRAFGGDGLPDLAAFADLSRRVSAHAAQLAADSPRVAASAGLLHGVGRLVLNGRAVPEGTHVKVGAYLLALWGLPQVVVDAVAQQLEPFDPPTDQETFTVGEAVRLAVARETP